MSGEIREIRRLRYTRHEPLIVVRPRWLIGRPTVEGDEKRKREREGRGGRGGGEKIKEGDAEKRRRREINFATRFVHLTARVDFHEGVKDIYGADCPDRMFHSVRDRVGRRWLCERTKRNSDRASRIERYFPGDSRTVPLLRSPRSPSSIRLCPDDRLGILMVWNRTWALQRFNYVTLVCFL